MNLTKNGLTIEVPDAVVVGLVLERLAGNQPTFAPQGATPRIGDRWPDQGGIYAGVMRGRDGAPDYHLLVGDAVETLKPIPWDRAMAAVKDMECDVTRTTRCPSAPSRRCSSPTCRSCLSRSGTGPVSSTPRTPTLPGCSTSATATRATTSSRSASALVPSADWSFGNLTI